MSEEKRVRRTPEQIAADLDVQIEKLKDSILELENKKAASATEFDNKIAAVKEKIAKLEAKKKDVLTPKKRKPRKSKADQIKLLVIISLPQPSGCGFSLSTGKFKREAPHHLKSPSDTDNFDLRYQQRQNKIAEYSLHVGSLYQDIVLKLSPMTSFEY